MKVLPLILERSREWQSDTRAHIIHVPVRKEPDLLRSSVMKRSCASAQFMVICRQRETYPPHHTHFSGTLLSKSFFKVFFCILRDVDSCSHASGRAGRESEHLLIYNGGSGGRWRR